MFFKNKYKKMMLNYDQIHILNKKAQPSKNDSWIGIIK